MSSSFIVQRLTVILLQNRISQHLQHGNAFGFHIVQANAASLLVYACLGDSYQENKDMVSDSCSIGHVETRDHTASVHDWHISHQLSDQASKWLFSTLLRSMLHGKSEQYKLSTTAVPTIDVKTVEPFTKTENGQRSPLESTIINVPRLPCGLVCSMTWGAIAPGFEILA